MERHLQKSSCHRERSPLIHRPGPNDSNLDDPGIASKGREQVSHVARVGRENYDLKVALTRVDHRYRDRRVDNVAGAGSTAELSRQASYRSIEGNLIASFERTGQASLSVRVPPSLTDGPGGCLYSVTVLERCAKYRPDLAVTTVESDQRPCVKNERRHRT